MARFYLRSTCTTTPINLNTPKLDVQNVLWLPQYESINGELYNKHKNHSLMKFLNDVANKHLTWDQLPKKIKQDFGNNSYYYKSYLKSQNALL